ncbi:MAG: isocitrate/isopropylmalate family dehydrogenase [Candidatus Marinamargulisbacteria bacterium]
MTSPKQQITVISGDGIGQEVVDATIKILEAASTPIQFDHCQAGERIFKQGNSTGVPEETLASIKKSKVVLKGPLTTPVGYGERSANVYLRKYFGLYANIRPVKQYPNIPSIYKDVPIDLVVIRENIEDLYAGIEYYHQPGIAQSIKLVTQYGCDHINAFAFEYAKRTKRASLHCATKANILKTTEGMMKKSFEHMSSSYDDVKAHHIIIDNCAHQLVVNPSQFDMIVTTNMNGDIISDLTSGLVGGLGIAPSANIGNDVAMFEAVHGAAPDIAGQNIANPTAMILSAVMMLRYIEMGAIADTIEQALAVTFEQGKFTKDLNRDNGLSTDQFTAAVIQNLGKSSSSFKSSVFKPVQLPEIKPPKTTKGVCFGVDIIIISNEPFDQLSERLNTIGIAEGFKPVVLSNRGKKVTMPEEHQIIPQWFCRFESNQDVLRTHQITNLINKVSNDYHWVQVEKLFKFND